MSTPIYSQILSKRYPTLQWEMDGNDYLSITATNGPIPSQATLDALWPGVETQLNIEIEIADKIQILQANYLLQIQVIEALRAISTGDKTIINSILTLWDDS